MNWFTIRLCKFPRICCIRMCVWQWFSALLYATLDFMPMPVYYIVVYIDVVGISAFSIRSSYYFLKLFFGFCTIFFSVLFYLVLVCESVLFVFGIKKQHVQAHTHTARCSKYQTIYIVHNGALSALNLRFVLYNTKHTHKFSIFFSCSFIIQELLILAGAFALLFYFFFQRSTCTHLLRFKQNKSENKCVFFWFSLSLSLLLFSLFYPLQCFMVFLLKSWI